MQGCIQYLDTVSQGLNAELSVSRAVHEAGEVLLELTMCSESELGMIVISAPVAETAYRTLGKACGPLVIKDRRPTLVQIARPAFISIISGQPSGKNRRRWVRQGNRRTAWLGRPSPR